MDASPEVRSEVYQVTGYGPGPSGLPVVPQVRTYHDQDEARRLLEGDDPGFRALAMETVPWTGPMTIMPAGASSLISVLILP